MLFFVPIRKGMTMFVATCGSPKIMQGVNPGSRGVPQEGDLNKKIVTYGQTDARTLDGMVTRVVRFSTAPPLVS